MQSLDLIKKRIKSIEATRKITNAMKLVATTKIKAQRRNYDATSYFCTQYYRLFKVLMQDAKNLDFLRKIPNKSKKNLYIIITSDLGLCGSYNQLVCKCLTNELKPNDDIAIYGAKGISWLKAHHLDKQIVRTRHYDAFNDSYYSILPGCYEVAESFISGYYDKIKLVYTKFETSVKYTPKIWTLLPISPETYKSTPTEKIDINSTIIEPSSKHILKSIIPIYISNFIYGALIESSLCESSARRFAMEGATKSASELIDNLKLQYNQARQESITQEINEIVAGSVGKGQ